MSLLTVVKRIWEQFEIVFRRTVTVILALAAGAAAGAAAYDLFYYYHAVQGLKLRVKGHHHFLCSQKSPCGSCRASSK